MPIIEFECLQCKSKKEVITSSADEKIKFPVCGTCKKEMTKVEFPITHFQLKGKGWFNSGGY